MEDCVYPGGLLQLISPTLFLCHTFTPHIPWVQICKNYHQILMTHLSCSGMVIRVILHERSMWVIRRQRILVIYY